MGDPGLRSEFIAQQQEERFSPAIDLGDRLISNYERSAMLDIARLTRLLVMARTDAQRQTLRAALSDASDRYRRVRR